MNSITDKSYMERCLELAAYAEGRTAPNPVVGAMVISADGQVAGEGYHQGPGLSHAEVVALDAAGEKAHDGILYVNLEPCSHWGKTPPCVERVIASGVKKVVTGMVDPNPLVAGKGIAALKQAGIEVEIGIAENKCRWLNRGFIKVMTEGLPWVCLKLACTLDGKIADRSGNSRWISGKQARAYVHTLRNKLDCVLIGAATAVKDNPQLDVRGITGSRNPARAVVDPELSLSPAASVCRAAQEEPVYLFCTREAEKLKGKTFPEHVSIVAVEGDKDSPGHLNLRCLLSWLAGQGHLNVLCEGGGRLAGSLLAANLVDEVNWIISAKIIGDSLSTPAVALDSEVLLKDAWPLQGLSVKPLGSDILIHGTLNPGWA